MQLFGTGSSVQPNFTLVRYMTLAVFVRIAPVPLICDSFPRQCMVANPLLPVGCHVLFSLQEMTGTLQCLLGAGRLHLEFSRLRRLRAHLFMVDRCMSCQRAPFLLAFSRAAARVRSESALGAAKVYVNQRFMGSAGIICGKLSGVVGSLILHCTQNISGVR